ncbi:uncharacterized protein LOC135155399 [Lytechinus pictus]|uniref:uncharacterized protein LOC135155399 n=1 Tax=Lytechinus pictus TaxID=7653 RepID=UPI0030BA0DDD
MVLSRLNSLEDIKSYRVKPTRSPASRVKAQGNISQEIVLEDFGVSMFIPKEAVHQDGSQEILLTLLRDPPIVDIQDDESVACYGIRCDPPNMVFLKPAKIRIPHAALVANPDEIKPDILSNEWDSVKELPRTSRSTSSNSPDKPPYCKVYKRHLELYIDHSAEWWVLVPLEQHVIRHQLLCTPYIPDRIEKGKETGVHLRFHASIPGIDMETQEEEKKQCYHKAHSSIPISMASRSGDVNVTCYRSDDVVDKKVLTLKDIQSRMQHRIVLLVPSREDDTDFPVTIILTQSGKRRVDVSVSLAFVIRCCDDQNLEPTLFARVVEEVSKGDLNEDDILNIAEKMTVDQFYDLGVALGFKISQLDSIEYQRNRDRQQASYDMLARWQQTQTSVQAAKEELITIMKTLDSPTEGICALDTSSVSEIPDKTLLDLSRKIKPEKYFETGRKLGLSKVELEHIRHRTFSNRRETNIQMLSTWKSSQPPGEKAVETLKLVWDSVQSVTKSENSEEDEDTSTVLKQVVVERAKQNELEQEQLKIIDFSETDDSSGSSCKHAEIHEDLDKHGGIPSTEELCNVARHIKTLQTARSLGKALRIDDITIVSYVTQQSHSLLHETAQQILRMWEDGLQEEVKKVELHKLLVKYNLSGDKPGGFTEIAKLIRSEADLVGLIHHLDVQPTSVLEVIKTSAALTPHMIIPVALKMLIEWSKKGTRERLVAIAQAFRFRGVDLLVKGLACHSSYQYFISYGIIDHKGGKLTLDVLGIAVSIPKGAIPKGMLSTATLRVLFRNIRRLPMRDDEVLITPVIETSLTQELLKPASIVLPHCMGFKNDYSTLVMYTKTRQGKFGRRILTGDDLRISKSTIEFCTRHIEVLAVCSTDLRDLQLTCLVFQPTMKSPADHPSLRVYVIHPYKAYTQDIIMKELTSSVPYCQVEKEFKFSIGSKSKHLTVICHEETKQQNQMIPLSGVLNGQCSPVVFMLQFTPEENGKKNIRIAIKERDEPISDREFNVAIEDEPDYTTNRRVSEGRWSCLSNNLIESLADVIPKQSDANSLGGYLGFSESTVEQYLDRSDSSKKCSRSGFVEMLSDWRRRVRPSEQVEELHRALKDAGLTYVTYTILHGVTGSSRPTVPQRVQKLESKK